MTLSLGRIIFIALLLAILAMGGIFAMDVYAHLHDVSHQYTTTSSI